MDLERAQAIFLRQSQIEELEKEIKEIRRPLEVTTDQATPTERFDAVFEAIEPLLISAKTETATRQTPKLCPPGHPEGPYLSFTRFAPSPEDIYSSRLSAWWTAEQEPQRSLVTESLSRNFLDPSRPAYKGAQPESWQSVLAELAELEKSVAAYRELALQLNPNEAQNLGFSDEFVKLLEENQ